MENTAAYGYAPDIGDNLVLEHLRHIRAVVDATRIDMHDLKHRVTAVEIGLAGIRREVAQVGENVALFSARFDRLEDRVERIERRLDIVPA